MGPSGQNSPVRVWPAFTDILMTLALILVFFLFAQIVIESQTIAVMKEIDRRQKALHHAVERAIPEVLRGDVTITEDGNLQRFTFADWILFESGRAELKSRGKEVLGPLGNVFAAHAEVFDRVQIEGHTDDQNLVPGSRFPSNWELSSARATSVVRFFETSALDPALLSATGYSMHRPIDDAPTEEARASNRRIEVVVVYSAASIRAQAHSPGSPPSRRSPESERLDGT